jgi:hypothetical protein
MRRILGPTLGIALAATAAFPAASQQAAGTVEGTLQLEDARWFVRPGGGDLPRSYWREGPDGYEVQLAAFPTREAEQADGAIVIRFRAEGEPDALEARAPMLRMPRRDATWRSVAENTFLSLVEAQRTGDALAVAGSVVGRLVIEPAKGTAAEDFRTVDAEFQATVYRDRQGE